MKDGKAEETLRELLLVAGFGALVTGLWMIHPPAALIIGGGLLIWVGLPKRRDE
ncbi:hypothetical protein [Paenibacillus stellifer]|uniref:hypothetical protein n=1 Tax=Paenibacillus stellifer TaxID=169760 RepID=UPI000A738E50|nr:hypothetical protein [Paenibacillus stellifer]